VAQTFAWTQGAVTAAGWLDWLNGLPFEIRQTLPDGTRFLGVHAAPAGDDIPIYPHINELELESLLDGCQADLICMGHTHLPMDLRSGGRHIVNLGSVSNPIAPDLRASYVLLTAGSSGYQIEHRRVDYDHQAVIETLERIRHPGAAFIIRHLRGEYKG
jgi:diadenosine tetraphosphatase ApaH/serine/threonine PP2A family protein phosphatase